MESGPGAALLVLVEKLSMTETTCTLTINGAIICTSHLMVQANTIHVQLTVHTYPINFHVLTISLKCRIV